MAETSFREAPNAPMAVLTPLTMTTSLIIILLLFHPVGRKVMK
jgi:hypothetical protein